MTSSLGNPVLSGPLSSNDGNTVSLKAGPTISNRLQDIIFSTSGYCAASSARLSTIPRKSSGIGLPSSRDHSAVKKAFARSIGVVPVCGHIDSTIQAIKNSNSHFGVTVGNLRGPFFRETELKVRFDARANHSSMLCCRPFEYRNFIGSM